MQSKIKAEAREEGGQENINKFFLKCVIAIGDASVVGKCAVQKKLKTEGEKKRGYKRRKKQNEKETSKSIQLLYIISIYKPNEKERRKVMGSILTSSQKTSTCQKEGGKREHEASLRACKCE